MASEQTPSQTSSQDPTNFYQMVGMLQGIQSDNPKVSVTPDDSAKLDLIKKLVKAEGAPIEQKEAVFEHFNSEIEKSFNEQQLYLDEIFKQTAKQFQTQ